MMKAISIPVLILLLAVPLVVHAQDRTGAAGGSFDGAAANVLQQLEKSVQELNALRERIANEKIPLSRQLSELESELVKVRLEYQQTTRLLDSRTLDLSNLRTEIKSRKEEAGYLSNLLSEYIRNFESRLHIAEIHRYEEALESAKLAPENSNLAEAEVFHAQAELLGVSLERLHDALGGTRFEGIAVDANGLVDHGTFVLVGPAALFRSTDGRNVGTAEQRLGSLEPAEIDFANPADAEAATRVITTATGAFPLDPTLGNAHKIAATRETLLEHIEKGGPVMYPIFALAGSALLVALYRWLGLAFLRKPSRKRIDALLKSVEDHDEEGAREKVQEIKGPVGQMLSAGVEHIKEPRELIEEVMYEKVLTTRLRLNRLLPFIAICAASAPLLGLLGTVTGIINTFKLITVFGSGDVKMLSGGISEALITTEFGLIVAIPSLLLHAFLSRKARGVVSQMETAAVAFVNQVSKSPFGRMSSAAAGHAAGSFAGSDPALLRAQVKEVIGELLAPIPGGRPAGHPASERHLAREGDFGQGPQIQTAYAAAPRLRDMVAANEKMNRLSRSAEQELARSIKGLYQLREQIEQVATDNLPDMQELTTLDEAVAQLRKEHQKVVRLMDDGSRKSADVEAERKARWNERRDRSGMAED